MTNQPTKPKNAAFLIIIIAVIMGTFLILFWNQNSVDAPPEAPENGQLDDGTTPLEETSLDQNLTVEQNFVKDYINGNLSELTDKEPSLGGSFYLADIIFLKDNEAMIAYEDGHSAYEALVEYDLNPKIMSVTDFQTLSQNSEVIVQDSPNPFADAAKRLLAEKHNLSFDEIDIDLNQMDLYHAKGVATLGDTPGDAAGILLTYENGEFNLVFEGNGDPSCDIIEQHDFPSFMAPNCY